MATIPTDASALVRSFAEKEWDRWKSDCSGYLKAVAADLGITLEGQANDIIATMRKAPWIPLGKDSVAASVNAAQGLFVVAGLAANPNGHVAIVVPGMVHGHARGYWGQLNGVGRKDESLSWSWSKADLKNVEYFALRIGYVCALPRNQMP